VCLRASPFGFFAFCVLRFANPVLGIVENASPCCCWFSFCTILAWDPPPIRKIMTFTSNLGECYRIPARLGVGVSIVEVGRENNAVLGRNTLFSLSKQRKKVRKKRAAYSTRKMPDQLSTESFTRMGSSLLYHLGFSALILQTCDFLLLTR
jgi:hypothetical protein